MLLKVNQLYSMDLIGYGHDNLLIVGTSWVHQLINNQELFCNVFLMDKVTQ